MQPRNARLSALLLGLALLGAGAGCEPTLLLALDVERVEAARLKRWQVSPLKPLILDVRDRAAFARGHVPGSLSVRLHELDGFLSRRRLDRGRRVVTVCSRGRLSVLAATVARERGFRKVYSLSGGIVAWRGQGHRLEQGPGPKLDPATLAPPKKRLSTALQVVSTSAGLVVKPLHMLLTFLLILILGRQRARDLTLLRRGLLAFLVGETFCALNFLSSAGLSVLLDHAHGLGMTVMSVLVPWALFVLLDERVLHVTDPDKGCAAQRFCKRCWKKEEATCGAQRLLLFAAPALALVALLPLCAPIRPFHVVSRVFDSDVHYVYDLWLQLWDFRALPLLAALSLLVATGLLLRGPRAMRRAQLPFFVGLGLASYALIRFTLLYAFRDVPPWRDLWEEATELLAMLAVAVILWVFRGPLGLRRSGADAR